MSKVIVITGATSGIGKKTAEKALAQGYFVMAAARNEESLKQMEQELDSENLATFPTDISDIKSLSKLKEATIERFGKIDVVFANAGITSGPTQYQGEQAEKWHEMIDTNVLGPALTANVFLPELKNTKGHFIITGSVIGRVAAEGRPYSMTKWAVSGMTESIRKEVRGTGIRVCCIEPGMVETPFWPKETDFNISLKPEDVALVVLFILEQPPHVDINEILIRPTGQAI